MSPIRPNRGPGSTGSNPNHNPNSNPNMPPSVLGKNKSKGKGKIPRAKRPHSVTNCMMLSAAVPGLGTAQAGQRTRGIRIFSLFASELVGAYTVPGPGLLTLMFAITAIFIWFYGIADAYYAIMENRVGYSDRRSWMSGYRYAMDHIVFSRNTSTIHNAIQDLDFKSPTEEDK